MAHLKVYVTHLVLILQNMNKYLDPTKQCSKFGIQIVMGIYISIFFILILITRLINALELFSGLIIFAESKFEEKARFLFDLFDFNELNSLSLIDLEFLLLSCANATFKILQI